LATHRTRFSFGGLFDLREKLSQILTSGEFARRQLIVKPTLAGNGGHHNDALLAIAQSAVRCPQSRAATDSDIGEFNSRR